MNRDEIFTIICELDRKLILLRLERKASKREDIIDSILLDEEGELQCLRKLFGLDKE